MGKWVAGLRTMLCEGLNASGCVFWEEGSTGNHTAEAVCAQQCLQFSLPAGIPKPIGR